MSQRSHHYLFQPGTAEALSLLLLHGTGGTERDLLPLAQRLSPHSAILSPRGNLSEHGANRFFARLAEGVFDSDEVTRRTHELADFISAASAEHHIDPARLIAVGFSNGANVAATLLQLRPEVLGGAILLRPMVVLNQSATPGSLAGKRVLISSGAQDPIVPATHPEELAQLLRAGGATVKVQTHPASHGLVAGDLQAAHAWLAD